MIKLQNCKCTFCKHIHILAQYCTLFWIYFEIYHCFIYQVNIMFCTNLFIYLLIFNLTLYCTFLFSFFKNFKIIHIYYVYYLFIIIMTLQFSPPTPSPQKQIVFCLYTICQLIQPYDQSGLPYNCFSNIFHATWNPN